MTRDDILSLSKSYRLNQQINQEDIINLITEYCKEEKRSNEDMDFLISSLPQLPLQLTVVLINNLLEYFEKKFNIIRISDMKDSNNIFDIEKILTII